MSIDDANNTIQKINLIIKYGNLNALEKEQLEYIKSLYEPMVQYMKISILNVKKNIKNDIQKLSN